MKSFKEGERNMNRLDTFCKLLEDIYGERIVESFTVRNKNNLTLKMNYEHNNQIAKKNYDRKDGEDCDTCKPNFRNIKTVNFFKRILEFPGWVEYLDFSGTTPAKEIMIIGEAPTKLKDQINIAFGLGFYPIEHDGKFNFDHLRKIYSKEEVKLKAIIKNQVSKNILWIYLNHLFLNKLEILKPKIYITDLCKCNDDVESDNKKEEKNQCMWRVCRDKYLIKEIKLINPKLIIFQGGSSYTFVMRYLKSEGLIKSKRSILEETERYYPKPGEPDYYEKSFSEPCFGKFPLNGNNYYFFKIYHQAYFVRWFKGLEGTQIFNYINQNHQFIKKKFLKEVLNIN